MVEAIFECDYKSTPFIEVIPAPLPSLQSSASEDFFDSELFACPQPATQCHKAEQVCHELTEYLDATLEPQSMDSIFWWKVSHYHLVG